MKRFYLFLIVLVVATLVVDACTVENDCNDHAILAIPNSEGNCTCVCRNAWSGATCDSCAPKFNASKDCAACSGDLTGYPLCAAACTINGNCSSHATSVYGNAATGCLCGCSNRWSGSDCSVCPPNYDATQDCNVCAEGFIDFPWCYNQSLTPAPAQCTIVANCSNHANNVVDVQPAGCACTCTNAWKGESCDTCPGNYDPLQDCAACATGYENYPFCSKVCSLTEDCSNHATKVEGSIFTGCQCTCRNAWTGSNCSICLPQFNSADDCGSCSAEFGLGGYPFCLNNSWTPAPKQCNEVANCSDHATFVTDNINNGSCDCFCRNSWRGDECDVCPPQYNASQDCGACADTHFGYPDCSRICTVNENCSSHASGVIGTDNLGCYCFCENRWSGSDCSTCAANYDPSKDCAACAPGFVDYPWCYNQSFTPAPTQCTIPNNCSNHAIYTADQPNGTCYCFCTNRWSGDDCSVCPEGHDPLQDCAACLPGYIGYPFCSKACTLEHNCSTHATGVVGSNAFGCLCTCTNSWSGTDCATCNANYNTSQDCGECAEGFIDYPWCYNQSWTPAPPRCYTETNCSGHAGLVFDGPNNTCSCLCNNAWSGSDCSICPMGYNAADDCSSCPPGYDGYPFCSPACTIARNCSGHASAVGGTDLYGCYCACSHRWSGSDCSVCPANYNGALDCGACAPGFIDYPFCYNQSWTPAPTQCSVVLDCSDHASYVFDNTNSTTGCTCFCKDAWTGPKCEVCPSQYDPIQSCAACAEGRSGYPLCAPECTIQGNCSDHANAVTGNTLTGCWCSCRNQWSGFQCQACPENYDASKDCGTCAPGFIDYPNCVNQSSTPAPVSCTSEKDCNDHAVYVRDAENSTCTCVCQNLWSGPRCGVCAPQYDSNKDCAACAPGYTGYPLCAPSCTVESNCSSHATAVVGNSLVGCYCTCTNLWQGADCSYCPPSADPLKDCGACAPGYSGYPLCQNGTSAPSESGHCTVTLNCSDHAASVKDSANNKTCDCQCTNRWSGPSCAMCPTEFDAAQDCAACAPGYSGYPLCAEACIMEKSCSNNAISVVGNDKTGCLCTCRNMWQGPMCAQCDTQFDKSKDCGTCSVGYSGYPLCVRDVVVPTLAPSPAPSQIGTPSPSESSVCSNLTSLNSCSATGDCMWIHSISKCMTSCHQKYSSVDDRLTCDDDINCQWFGGSCQQACRTANYGGPASCGVLSSYCQYVGASCVGDCMTYSTPSTCNGQYGLLACYWNSTVETCLKNTSYHPSGVPTAMTTPSPLTPKPQTPQPSPGPSSSSTAAPTDTPPTSSSMSVGTTTNPTDTVAPTAAPPSTTADESTVFTAVLSSTVTSDSQKAFFIKLRSELNISDSILIDSFVKVVPSANSTSISWVFIGSNHQSYTRALEASLKQDPSETKKTLGISNLAYTQSNAALSGPVGQKDEGLPPAIIAAAAVGGVIVVLVVVGIVCAVGGKKKRSGDGTAGEDYLAGENLGENMNNIQADDAGYQPPAAHDTERSGDVV